MRRAAAYSDSRDQGFTLVELLVALAVGSMMLAGVLTLFVNGRHTYRMQEGMWQLQESARFVIDELGTKARMAGYDNPDSAFFPPAPGLQATNNPDTLTVVFEGGPGVMDCFGETTAAGSTISNTFAVVNGNLECTRQIDADPPEMEIVVEGVEVLELRFGLDLDDDGVPNRIVDADGVAGNWDDVLSLEFGFLIRTVSEAGNELDTRTYQVLGTAFDPVDDRRTRRVLSSEVALRN